MDKEETNSKQNHAINQKNNGMQNLNTQLGHDRIIAWAHHQTGHAVTRALQHG